VRRAAEIQGRSVSDFVVAAAQEAASWIIELIRLSVETSGESPICVPAVVISSLHPFLE
jgi:hypothetical protein